MRYLELRRHTMRHKPGDHLTQAGVSLARRVGGGIGPFAHVVTSDLARAFETAIAMGFAVDEQLPALAMLGPAVEAEVGVWDAGFAAYARAYGMGRATRDYADRLADLLRRLVQRIPDGAAMLVVSHGGIIEAAAVGCLPTADHNTWGRGCDYCEGVRLNFDGDKFVAAQILRVDQTTIRPY